MSDGQRFSALLSAKIESVKLEMDANGFTRVLFQDDELKDVNAYLAEELTRTKQDYEPLWQAAVENLETYKAIKMSIADGGTAIYPAPLARIPADQVIAATYDSVMQPRPVFSFDAYLNAEYQVPQAIPTTPPMLMPSQAGPGLSLAQPPPGPLGASAPPLGGSPPASAPLPALGSQVAALSFTTSEEIAKRLRQGYEFIIRERIDFPRKFLKAVGHAVKGCPFWWKVDADPTEQTKLTPKAQDSLIDLDDKYESTRMRGDIVKHYLVPYFNGMKPVDEDDMALSPWFAERKRVRPDDILKNHAAGVYFLIADDAEAKNLSENLSDIYDPFRARAASTTEKKTPQKPAQDCNVWRTWFYRNVRYKDPADGKTKVKRLNCVGDFHLNGSKLLDCYLNQYEHQERPYELIDQFDDGGSTVENMKYHQHTFTHLGQAEIKNIYVSNNVMFWYDPDSSDVVTFFKAHPKLGPGDHIPGVKDKDWGYAVAGEQHTSMLELMKFILSMSQLDSKQNKYSTGDPGGRTPAYTMQQAIARSEMEPHLFLHRLSSKFSRIMRLDMETRRQFQPLGEVLPVWDAEAKATIEIPFRLPVGDVLDNFRIALTASDEALAKEQDPQQMMALKQALMTDGEYIAKVIAPILNLQNPLPPATVALFAKIIKRDQMVLRDLVDSTTTDDDSYDITKELEALINERNQALQQIQQNPPPSAEQQPHVTYSIAVAAKLTPEQEIALAEKLGIGGMSAQIPTSGGGQNLSHQHPGGPGGPPPLGGEHGIPPHPAIAPEQGSQISHGGVGVQ